MMQKEEFENYKHMIVSEQPIFHAYIDMRSNVQYHINVYVSPGIKHTIIFSGFRTQQRIKAEPSYGACYTRYIPCELCVQ